MVKFGFGDQIKDKAIGCMRESVNRWKRARSGPGFRGEKCANGNGETSGEFKIRANAVSYGVGRGKKVSVMVLKKRGSGMRRKGRNRRRRRRRISRG